MSFFQKILLLILCLLFSAAVLTISFDQARAQSIVIRSGETVDQTQNIGTDGTGTVEAGGAINVPGGQAIRVHGRDATVNNAGSIRSNSPSHDNSGIFVVHGGTIQTLINSGTITARRFGIYANHIDVLTNSGEIYAGGRPDGCPYSCIFDGIFVANIGLLTNSGVITGDRHGVNVNFATIVNTGTIRGGTRDRDAGLIMSSGNVRNSGLIEGAAGIDINRYHGGNTLITNSGTIRSTNGPSGTAINFRRKGEDTLAVLGDYTIVGKIGWDGVGDTVSFGRGRSSSLTFSDAEGPRRGDPQEFDIGRLTIQTAGQPFAVRGNTVAVVDPTAFSMADEVLSDLTGSIHDAILNNRHSNTIQITADRGPIVLGGGAHAAATPMTGETGDPRVWAEVFGGVRDQKDGSRTLDAKHKFGGIVAGVDRAVSRGTRLGLFAGGSTGTVDVAFNSQDVDVDSVFGGLYGAHTGEDYEVDFSVLVGLADHGSTRRIANNTVAGGTQKAQADYTGVFVSPELALSSTFALNEHVKVRPGVRFRYAGLFTEGYREKGAASDLDVDSRDLHVLEARAQLGFPFAGRSDEHGTLSTQAHIGIEGRTTLSGDRVSGSLLGQSIDFDAGGDDNVGSAFAGVSFSMSMINNVSVFGTLEGAYDTQKAIRGTGRIGAKVQF